MAAEGQLDKIVSDMELFMKLRCGTEFLHAQKMAPTDIHKCLLNVYGDQMVNMSTVKDALRGQHFPSNNSIIAAVKQWVTSAGALVYR